jgi:hypothetical protein
VELWQAVAANGLKLDITEDALRRALGVAGGVQIGLALALLSARSRPLAALATLWGLLSAASWTLAYGRRGYDQTLLCSAQATAPLCVLLFWLAAVRERRPSYVPEQAAAVKPQSALSQAMSAAR